LRDDDQLNAAIGELPVYQHGLAVPRMERIVDPTFERLFVLDCTKVASLAIDLSDLRPPHRMGTIEDCFQTDAIDPAMYQPGILSGG
jgi:hypothetical protein